MTISRDNYEVYFLDYIEGKLRAEMHEELQLFLQHNPDLAAELEEIQLFQEQNNFSIGKEELSFDDKNSLKKTESTAQEDLIDELLAKELEGDLAKDERVLLDKLALGSSLVEKWRKAYALTKLQSSKEEVFADKDAVRIPSAIDHSSIHELLIAHCEGDLNEEENLMLESLLASDQALRTELSLFSLTRLAPEAISFPAKNALYKKETPVISLRRVYYGVAAAASVALLLAVINYTDKSSALTVASFTPRVEVKSMTTSPNSKEQLAQDNKRQETISINTSVNTSNNDVAIAVEPKRKEIFEERKNTQQQTRTPQHEPVVLPAEYLQYRDAENLVTHTPKGLEYEIPEMKKVYEQPIHHSANTQESITLLAFLGKAASSRIMGTDAYTYTESQLQLLAQRVNRNFKFERIPLDTKDQLLLKIGRFEIQKPISRKETNGQKSLWERARKLIEKKELK